MTDIDKLVADIYSIMHDRPQDNLADAVLAIRKRLAAEDGPALRPNTLAILDRAIEEGVRSGLHATVRAWTKHGTRGYPEQIRDPETDKFRDDTEEMIEAVQRAVFGAILAVFDTGEGKDL